VIMDEDQKIMDEMMTVQQNYKEEVVSLEENLKIVTELEEIDSKKLDSLKKDLDRKVILLSKIHQEKDFYETAVKELQLAAQDLKQTFSKIEKKRKYETTLSSQFVESKNQLPFPFEGKIIRGDKLLGLKNRNFNKGVFIEGSETEVKAIFPGRIDFSGRVKGYGEIVIINHGSRFFTISAQLSRRLMEEGAMVETGDVIGLVGNNGATKKSRLYFEIRKAGKSLDPLSWLKVK